MTRAAIAEADASRGRVGNDAAGQEEILERVEMHVSDRHLAEKPVDAALIKRIRDAIPDILFVAPGQPRGEKWIAENFRLPGVPLCVQVGASIDFVVGSVARASRWMPRFELEWAFRLAVERRRLSGRYWKNSVFLVKALLRDLWGMWRGGSGNRTTSFRNGFAPDRVLRVNQNGG